MDDPNNTKYYKLKQMKGARTLHCLLFKEVKAYKILYKTGRAFSIANNTLNHRMIKAHLSKLFDCHVGVMCCNINWKADDLMLHPGVFKLMAFLDRAPLGSQFDDLDPSKLDGNSIPFSIINSRSMYCLDYKTWKIQLTSFKEI